MKKLHVLFAIAVFMFLSSTNVSAKEGEKSKKHRKKADIGVASQISNMINYSGNSDRYPEFVFENKISNLEGIVVIRFNVNNAGNIEIKEMQSNNQNLKDFVSCNLNGKNATKIEKSETDYLVKLAFHNE